MRQKGIRRKLDIVLKNIRYEMQPESGESMYAGGMRGEGYLGGYRAAIMDVKLALDGVRPTTRYLWDNREEVTDE